MRTGRVRRSCTMSSASGRVAAQTWRHRRLPLQTFERPTTRTTFTPDHLDTANCPSRTGPAGCTCARQTMPSAMSRCAAPSSPCPPHNDDDDVLRAVFAYRTDRGAVFDDSRDERIVEGFAGRPSQRTHCDPKEQERARQRPVESPRDGASGWCVEFLSGQKYPLLCDLRARGPARAHRELHGQRQQ
jgi:hypothetical protein